MSRSNRSRSRDYDRRDRDDSRQQPKARGREVDEGRDRQRSRYNDARDDSRPRNRSRNDEHIDRDRGRNEDNRVRRRSRSRDVEEGYRDRQRDRVRDRDRGDYRDRSPDRDRREQRRGNASDDERRSRDARGGDKAESMKPVEQSTKSDVPDWVRDLVDPTPQPAAAPVSSGQRFICIPEQFVSKVLGYQRCIINEIQTTTQTSIHMNQNLGKGYTVATITSTIPGAVEKAEAMINARIEAGMKTQAAYAQGYHGMGKGGKATLSSGALPFAGFNM